MANNQGRVPRSSDKRCWEAAAAHCMQRTAPATVKKQAVVKQGGGFAHDDEERLTSGFMRHGLGSFSRFWAQAPKAR